MAVYTPEELDALRYAEAAGDELTNNYYPAEIRRPAFDTMIALSRLAIVIKKQPNPNETWPEHSEVIDRLAEAATDVAVVIFSNLPMASMALMEHQDQLAHPANRRRYYPRRNYEKAVQSGEPLSPSETEVACYLYKGMSPTHIAQATGRQRTNVTTHLGNAYLKLGAAGANSREMAVKKLFELGIFKDEEQIHPETFSLTPRQKDILRLLMNGLGREESAASLGINPCTVTYEVRSIRKKLGLESTHAVVRAILEAGGLDAISEPKIEDRNKPFLENVEIRKSRYGLYSRWLMDIFSSNPDTPFSMEALAKILYGEKYTKAQRLVFIGRVHSVFYQLEQPPNGKGKIALRRNLAKIGLQLSRVDLPVPDGQPSVRYISHSSLLEPAESYTGKDLSDEDLKDIAINLRQQELSRQAEESSERPVDGDSETWSEGEVIELDTQKFLAKAISPNQSRN